MTQCLEEIQDILGHALGPDEIARRGPDVVRNDATGRWEQAKAIIGTERATLGPQATQQFLHAPDHLAMVLARYRAAAALIGDAKRVAELGCGEGIGVGILAKSRQEYAGLDPDAYAIAVAQQTYPRMCAQFAPRDDAWLGAAGRAGWYDAVVSLDVIEHIPADREDAFMVNVVRGLAPHGVCVVGTPSENAAHLASPQSRAGHVNLYTPERLRAMMSCYFKVVQMVFMQDVSIHFGHPGMAHYMIAVGIGPR